MRKISKKDHSSKKCANKRYVFWWAALSLLILGFAFFIWAKQPDNLREVKDKIHHMTWEWQSKEHGAYNAKSLLVIDRQSDDAFILKNEHKPLPPASLAKLFTVEYVSEQADLKQKVKVTKAALSHVKKGSSVARLQAGETYTLQDLFAAMLVPSGNDAAYVVADYWGGVKHPKAKTSKERIALYLKDLNAYIQKQGWKNTHLYDPSGYDYEGTTTVSELKDVSDLLLKKKWFRKIVSQSNYAVTLSDGTQKAWKNTNHFLNPKDPNYNPAVKGIKTGSLDQDFNIIVLFEKNHKEYLILSIGSQSDDSRYDDINYILKSI